MFKKKSIKLDQKRVKALRKHVAKFPEPDACLELAQLVVEEQDRGEIAASGVMDVVCPHIMEGTEDMYNAIFVVSGVGSISGKETVLNSGVLPRIIEISSSSKDFDGEFDPRWPAVGCLRNLLSYPTTMDVKLAILKGGGFKAALNATLHFWQSDPETRDNATGCLAGLTGVPGLTQYLDDDYIPAMVEVFDLAMSTEGDSLKHVTIALANVATFASTDKRNELLNADVHKRFFALTKFAQDEAEAKAANAVMAALGLIRLVGHVENHPMLVANSKLLDMLIECMMMNRKGEMYHNTMAEEWFMFGAMAVLSTSDSNKKLLKDCKAVESCCDGYRPGRPPANDIHPEAAVLSCRRMCEFLSNMSFEYDLREDFDIDVEQVIRSILEVTDDEEVKKYADVAFFQQNQRYAPRQSLKRRREKGHVMISYPWAYQSRIIKVKEFLESQGVKVWFDVDQMSGSTLEAMASAIEAASAVVVCLCPEYKESPNCRAEGEYAFNLRKKIVPLLLKEKFKPDGWLGIMVGSALYFDMTRDDVMPKTLPQFFNELSRHLEGTSGKEAKKRPDAALEQAASEFGFPTGSLSASDSSAPAESQPAPAFHLSEVKALLDGLEQRLKSHVDQRFAKLEGRIEALESVVSKKP